MQGGRKGKREWSEGGREVECRRKRGRIKRTEHKRWREKAKARGDKSRGGERRGGAESEKGGVGTKKKKERQERME